MYDLGILNGRVYLDNIFVKTNVYIDKEKIVCISEEVLECKKNIDCKNKMVLPGLIDSHVHFSLKVGEFVSADNFESGPKTAAYGGITTFIDFTDPIYNEKELVNAINKRKKEAENSSLDYSFHVTLGNFNGNVDELIRICKEEGINSIKVFTTYSESNRKCSYEVIEKLLDNDIVVLAHSESDKLIETKWNNVETYEKSRPIAAEMESTIKLCEILSKRKGKLYIVHVSAGSTVKAVKNKYHKLLGKQLFLESCPQYFNFSKSVYKDEFGKLYLLAPPLRSFREMESLKKKIKYIDSIATDHCPFMIEEKFKYHKAYKVPKGIGGIEHSFSLMYTLFGNEIIPKFTSNPAEIFGLKNKGKIQIGMDGDIVIYDESFARNIAENHSKCDYCVYEGFVVMGKVFYTISKGKIIVDSQNFYGGDGKFIRR